MSLKMNQFSTRASFEDFLWHDKTYSTQDFLQKFKAKLPLLVTGIEGCSCKVYNSNLKADQICFVYDILEEPRLIAKVSATGQLTSIPLTYATAIHLINLDKSRGPATLLKDIPSLEKCAKSNTNFIFETDPFMAFYTTEDLNSEVLFGKLQMLEVCKQPYILLRKFDQGTISTDVEVIPAFCSSKIRHATSLTEENGGFARWVRYLLQLQRTVEHQVTSTAATITEIMLYEKKRFNTKKYECTEPVSLITRSNRKSDSEPSTYDDLEEETLPNSPRYTADPTSPGKPNPEAMYSNVYEELSLAHTPQIERSVSEGCVRKPIPAPKPKLTRDQRESLTFRKDSCSGHEVPDSLLASQSGRSSLSISAQSLPRPDRNRPRRNVERRAHTVKLDSTLGVKNFNPRHDYLDDCSFTSLKEIPTDLSGLNKRNIAGCLQLLGMSKYAEQFISRDVDGPLLSMMKEEMLMQDFSMRSFEAMKLCQFIKGWRPLE